MADTKFDVPIWQKLREMSDSEYCPFVLWNGAKRLIKREKLDKYLAEMYSI